LTVANEDYTSGPLTTDGVTTVFPYGFRIIATDQIEVVRRDADGVETAITTGFTVTGAGDDDGGDVTFDTAPAAGDPIYIRANPSFEQDAQLINQGSYSPAVVEAALDASALRDLRLRAETDRSLKTVWGADAPPNVGDLSAAEGKVLGVVDGIIVGVDNEAVAIASQVADAEQAADEAAIAADNANAAVTEAETAAALAVAVGYGGEPYPVAARSYVPKHATGVGAITGGSGGTNGTFALAFTGGNFLINPTGTFTVAGGALTAVTITGGGLYIGAAINAPALSFAASAGLGGGAAAALTTDYKVAAGSGYWAATSDDTALTWFTNVAGVATISSPLIEIAQAINTTDQLVDMAAVLRAMTMYRPTKAKPVMALKLTSKAWYVMGPVFEDDGTTIRRGDYSRYLMYDAGEWQSITRCFELLGTDAEVRGVRIPYADFDSHEINATTFAGLTPSTNSLARNIGLYGEALGTYNRYGPWHGQLTYRSFSLTVSGDATNYRDAAVGTILRGTSIVFDGSYGIKLPATSSAANLVVGTLGLAHTFDNLGLTTAHQSIVGQPLPFNTGTAEIFVGNTITGQTSGATATVVIVSGVATQAMTGTWGGGDAAGELFVTGITGVFQNGENLRVGGVTKAKAANVIRCGPVASQNDYSQMLAMTRVNRCKGISLPSITIGREDDAQLGNMSGGTGSQGNFGPITTFAAWHTDTSDVLLEMVLTAGYPSNPPSNWSEDTTSITFLQDRSEGVRKFYVNSRSGVAGILLAGTYTSTSRIRWRVGTAV
jgi:hypothetical protein